MRTTKWLTVGFGNRHRRSTIKILYYSCHEILEYDEVRLLRELGHVVFSLGAAFNQTSGFRPIIEQSQGFEHLYELFHSEGCKKGGNYWEYHLTTGFIEAFDISIVMSDGGLIVDQWQALSCRPVVWRTVGMGLETFEWLLEVPREMGMKIVRYSPAERRHPAYLGEDSLIRFYTKPVGQWNGSAKQVLTFSNDYAARYPRELGFFERSLGEIPTKIGGRGNENIRGATGLVSAAEQVSLLQTSRAYFYCHGTHIPYTLNFIEAWSSGIPVVALDPRSGISDRNAKYSEIGSLITNGETGFLVEEEQEAHAILQRLLEDAAYGRKIGAAGEMAAQAIFSYATVKRQWEEFLTGLSSEFGL